jgi:uncharacterized protein (TIGR02265 family)
MPTGQGTASEAWPEGPITLAQAERFASAIATSTVDRVTIAQNLFNLPPELKIRGFFFDGLCQIVEKTRDRETLVRLQRTAAVPEKLGPFENYMVRDFYKLYYHTASLLHGELPFEEAIRKVTQTFFPIFKTTMVGKTLSAFMGSTPATIIPVVAKAYTVSVSGNEHSVVTSGPNEIVWRCTVEPVVWYPESLQGIIEGALPANQRITMHTMERKAHGKLMRYAFRITW